MDLGYRWRLRLVLVVLLALCAVLVTQLVYLHVFERSFLRGQGDARTLRVIEMPAHRGMVLDRNGEPLAVSAPVESLWINPQEFSATDAQRKQFAEAADISVSRLAQLLDKYSGRQFVYVNRHMVPSEARRVLSLGLPGVYTDKEYKRYYPAAEVATHLVGFTDVDGKGQEGLELAYDEWLRGVPGKKRVLRDRLGRTIKDIQALETAQPGKDLQLSIDLRVQYMAYRELKAAVQQHHAKSGAAVVLDAKTGEVLAMVNQPSYNPNDRSRIKPAYLRNRSITDTFEPGSTVKPFTVAAAISSGKYRADSQIDTAPGYWRVKNKTIRDARNYGTLDMLTIIKKSSNVGVSKLALSLEPDAVRNMLFNAGLGQATGSGFPGEQAGSLPHYSEKRLVERATMSYGYGLAVTPLQLAQAYMTFATGGIKRPVSLLKVDAEVSGERIMPDDVAESVLKMMEAVTQKGGTGTRAQVPAYRVAGKSGTAHKVGSSGYADDQYRAFFAGVAPVKNPRLVTVVMIDDPQGEEYYGGEVAAPVFSRVMAGALRLMNVAPDAMPSDAAGQLVMNGNGW